MAKSRKSGDIKLSPSDASLYKVDETSNSEGEPGAICLGYTLVNANDKETIILFYHYCFASIGALSMKRILKVWIKVMQDKKQVTNPYKYRERSKPKWWPATTDDLDSNCRHIEPDHLQNRGQSIDI